MGVRPQGVRGKMLNLCVFSTTVSAPRLSERLTLIAFPFVVKHCIGEIARCPRLPIAPVAYFLTSLTPVPIKSTCIIRHGEPQS